ncbi:MAG: PfkB family carbohydrate kinase [Thermoplasmata archaeon]|nr:PfkB family carbohydrate kinase [Thermoplasmata archaeon]MCI4338227.1 PfkB family carbohydrate kinase [Thermoplasmata archaeon]MCI4341625.1 PfkB family carbohydrate kinase [Thermoplasmata archaeon]
MSGPVGALRERSRQLLVAGHVNIDRFLELPHLPEADRTVPVRSVHEALGGPAATIARQAATRGVRTGIVSRVGEDFPVAFTAQLRAERIDLAGLERVARARSPTCYILHDRRGHQVSAMFQGPMGQAGAAKIPRALLSRYDWLHLSTGDPRFQLRLQRAARQHGMHVAVDPAQELHYWWKPGPLRRLLEGAELLFVNRSEFDRVRALLRLRSARELLAIVPHVVVTLGSAGAVAYHRAGTEKAPGLPVRGKRQVTGAGDAFRGGFYAEWFAGAPLGECLRAGNRAAVGWMRYPQLPARARAHR